MVKNDKINLFMIISVHRAKEKGRKHNRRPWFFNDQETLCKERMVEILFPICFNGVKCGVDKVLLPCDKIVVQSINTTDVNNYTYSEFLKSIICCMIFSQTESIPYFQNLIFLQLNHSF